MYFPSVLTKIDQFLCDRSVVRTLFFFFFFYKNVVFPAQAEYSVTKIDQLPIEWPTKL